VIESEQLDIFIPLHRGRQLYQWAHIALENDMDVAAPDGVRAFANWLRENGHAPAGLSQESLTVLVAAIGEYAVSGGATSGAFY
jgi:hypothetical protein